MSRIRIGWKCARCKRDGALSFDAAAPLSSVVDGVRALHEEQQGVTGDRSACNGSYGEPSVLTLRVLWTE